MSGPISLRPKMRVTWVFLLAEWVLDLLPHDFHVGHLQAESSLVFGRPRPCPLDQAIADGVV